MENNKMLEMLASVDTIIGQKARVIKKDKRDDYYGIAEHLRWHIGDEFIIRKIEILPYGCFLYDNEGQNVSIKRVTII